VRGESLRTQDANYTCYRADNSILEQGRACYTVRGDRASWKIVALTKIKPPILGPGDIAR